ncbi:MAG TPA: hypothetical protein VFQ67_01365 [Allosphingosinicella sp.]|jgi:hypothetical protein|nr:hypothetical protein [Allosphingosinicella sp.]
MIRRPAAALAGVAALAGTAAAAAAPPAEPFCAELRAVVAAAQERPAFASMPAGVRRPMLGFAECEVQAFLDASFICMEDSPDSKRRWQGLVDSIRACLPKASPYRERGMSPPRGGELKSVLRSGRAIILIHEDGYANLPQRYVALHIEPKLGR